MLTSYTCRYVFGEPGSNLKVPSTSEGPTRRSSFEDDRKALKELHQSSLATNAGLGYGLASSISRDLHREGHSGRSTRVPLTAPNDLSSKSQPQSPLLSASPSFAPVLEDPTSGVLSKVCGSLIEPQEKRDKWNCKQCHTVFARDALIYAAPASASISTLPTLDELSEKRGRSRESVTPASRDRSPAPGTDPGSYYCKGCYTELFALGVCGSVDCGKPVLGSTKEDGAFVRVGSTGEIYHGRCFKCSHCGVGGGRSPAGDETEIIIGMDGKPTCNDCFDRPAPKRSVPGFVTKAQAADEEREAAIKLDLASRREMSGSATKDKKMAASIAELSSRFGRAGSAAGVTRTSITSPSNPSSSSPLVRSGGSTPAGPSPLLSSSSSFSYGLSSSPPKPRPATAQFAGEKFNLAAFQASGVGSTRTAHGHPSRSDSRSRSLSPTKKMWEPTPGSIAETPAAPVAPTTGKCTFCGTGPFEGPQKDAEEAVMVGLQGGEQIHRECFNCGICRKQIDASKAFVRLEELLDEADLLSRDLKGLKYAHPACAPMSIVNRPAPLQTSAIPTSTYNLGNSPRDHATHQRDPRSPGVSPSSTDRRTPVVVSSYLLKAEGNGNATSSSASSRQFRSTAGAAPPTASTLLARPSSSSGAVPAVRNLAAGMFSKRNGSASSSGTSGLHDNIARFGGMQQCPMCEGTVTALESVPGPRGTRWHRSCLTCVGEVAGRAKGGRCGKKLDSGAKVDVQGRVMCRDCFDKAQRDTRSFPVAVPVRY